MNPNKRDPSESEKRTMFSFSTGNSRIAQEKFPKVFIPLFPERRYNSAPGTKKFQI